MRCGGCATHTRPRYRLQNGVCGEYAEDAWAANAAEIADGMLRQHPYHQHCSGHVHSAKSTEGLPWPRAAWLLSNGVLLNSNSARYAIATHNPARAHPSCCGRLAALTAVLVAHPDRAMVRMKHCPRPSIPRSQSCAPNACGSASAGAVCELCELCNHWHPKRPQSAKTCAELVAGRWVDARRRR